MIGGQDFTQVNFGIYCLDLPHVNYIYQRYMPFLDKASHAAKMESDVLVIRHIENPDKKDEIIKVKDQFEALSIVNDRELERK